MTKHVTAGMPDTIYHDGWDSIAHAWTPIAMDAVHYNSDDDPDTLDQYLYNWTAYSPTPDYTTVYYYETFIDTTPTLKVTLPQTGKLNIYPNPARASIHVAPDNMPANQNYAVYILNMTGQVVQQVSVTSYTGKDITVAHLPPGMYEVVLKSSGGQVYTGKFIRE